MKKSNLKKHCFYLILILCIGACAGPTNQSTKISQDLHRDTIPFELTSYNNLLIKSVFNKVDTLSLMFHLGTNGVSLTSEGLDKTSGIKVDKSANVNSWGGSREAGYSTNNYLEIQNFSWDSIGITESRRSGHFSDGKIGFNFWLDKVMEIDFDASQIMIYDSLNTKPVDFNAMEVQFKDGMMFIDGAISIGDSVFQNSFLIHSGYSGVAMLDDAFVEQHRINEKLETIKESTLQDSNGNSLITKTVLTPKFSIGGFDLTDVPIGTFAGQIKRQSMSILGGDLLKRFHIIFDFPNEKLYLRPSEKKAEPYFDKVG